MSRLVGQQAEDSACAYLIKQGLQFVTRNFNCRLGEIDLIFKDGDELVFVEVKLRKNSIYGSGLESITTQKQAKIIKAAEYFLLQHQEYQSLACRFDAVCLDHSGNIEWVSAAFIGQ